MPKLACWNRLYAVHHATPDCARGLEREPTLSTTLRSLVHTEAAERFYQLLQFAVPVAVQFAAMGWWRGAASMAALSAFGLWGLCEQHLQLDDVQDRRTLWLRAGRGAAGFFAGSVGGALLIERFLRALGTAPIS